MKIVVPFRAAWGYNDSGQTNVPASLTNVTAVAGGMRSSLALRSDGTVWQWGYGSNSTPAVLTNPATANVTALSAGNQFSVAARSDGTALAWGDNSLGQTNVPSSATNIVSVAAGYSHTVALRTNGTVVAWGYNGSGQTNVPAMLTNPATANVMAVAAGWYHSMALRNDGTVIAWGYNGYGQTNVPTALTNVHWIAAGGYQSLASIHSSWIQYTIDVSKDLLLIYNTNSMDSSNVWAYYMQHRPLVGNANVLPIGCPPQETISRTGDTNLNLSSITRPIGQWLTNNPTKRPQYWILFPDIPSRINPYTNTSPTATTNYFLAGGHTDNSVTYELYSTMPHNPFVTQIWMETTNDCKTYIDKLEYFGTNGEPEILISASQRSYANTNFIIDNIAFAEYSPGSVLSETAAGLIGAGVSTNAIIYVAGSEPLSHIYSATNIAGYASWGAHSNLGNAYATNGVLHWSGSSSWWIIETIESYNGLRYLGDQGHMPQWFSPNAFGGIGYSTTPAGAVCHTDEPGAAGVNDPSQYFSLWFAGKNFGVAAWKSSRTRTFLAVGDPLIRR